MSLICTNLYIYINYCMCVYMYSYTYMNIYWIYILLYIPIYSIYIYIFTYFLWPVDWGKESSGLVYKCLHMIYSSITQKWIAVALQSLSGTPLKDSGKRKSYQWAELWAGHLDVHWKEKWQEIRVYIGSWLWPIAWLDGWGLRRSMTRELATRKLGEEVCV